MKNIFKKVTVGLVLALAVGCSDEYFDVNTPGNSITPEQTALKDLIAPTIVYTMSAHYSVASSVAQVDQHITSAFADQNISNHYQNGLDGFWFNAYVRALGNIQQLENKAVQENASHYLGIAQVLKAVNVGALTDIYGDIPYSEALKTGAVLYPKYDSQQSIYVEINKLLDDAIANFSAPSTSATKPGKEDLIYGGDITKWLKAAYTFKARFALHLSKINGTTAHNQVIANLAKGFTSNADDFQLRYNAINLNPWHASQLGLNTGNASFFISKQFINQMNGVSFPFASVTMDPRLRVLVDIRNYPNPTTSTTNPDPSIVANYRGAENGQGGTGANARIGIDFFYSKNDSPLVILSFAEAKFMEAEAQFIIGGGNSTSTGANAAAHAAYIAGINANMSKLAIPTASVTAYLADTSIQKSAATLELKDIMRQKFIALFLNPETFTDYRRYDFSTNVFVGLTLPKAADVLNKGQWIRRFVYSSAERATNTANYELNFKPMIERVWWDK